MGGAMGGGIGGAMGGAKAGVVRASVGVRGGGGGATLFSAGALGRGGGGGGGGAKESATPSGADTSFADGGSWGASSSRVVIMSQEGGMEGEATGFPKLELPAGGATGHWTGSGGLLDLIVGFRMVPVLSACFPETFMP